MKIPRFPISLAGSFLAISAHAQIQTLTLAEWTFENNPIPSALIGSSVGPFLPESGEGEMRGYHASNSTSWNTTVAGNGSPAALSSNRWAPGDYLEFRIPFSGPGETTISWNQLRSSTAPPDFSLQFSTDGAEFVPLTTYSVSTGAWSGTTQNPAFVFSHTLENPVPVGTNHLTFRFVATSTANGTSGTTRIDNVKITRIENRYSVSVSGRDLEVERWGTGPKGVLFFSHSGNLALTFKWNSDLVRELAGTEYSVFAWSYPVDLPPFNAVNNTLGSWVGNQLAIENRLLFPGVASSVLAQIRAATGIEEFVLVGNSLGAGVILSDYDLLVGDPNCRMVLISPTEAFIPPTLPADLEKTVMVSDPENDFWLRRPTDKEFCLRNSNAPFPYGIATPRHIIISDAASLAHAFQLAKMAHAGPSHAVVTAPPMDEFLQPGAVLQAGWYADFPEGPVEIDVLKAGQLAANLSGSASNNGNFFWNIPEEIEAGTDYTLRVRSVSDPATFVESDTSFRIGHLILENPSSGTSTIVSGISFQGVMGPAVSKGFTWVNHSNLQTGTVSPNSQWTTEIPLTYGSNFIELRAGIHETQMRANDSPLNSTYDAGWLDGANGGAGFGAWELLRLNDGFAGHALFGPDVFNVPPSFGGAFSLWASGEGVSTARRDFLRRLTIADTFTLQFDNNFIEAGKSVGFALADNTGTKRMEFFFVGYEMHYRLRDAAGERVTSLGYTDQGIEISIRLTESDGYILSTGAATLTGTLAPGGPVSRLIATNNGSGGETAYDLYLGQMQISDSIGIWASDSPADPAYANGWTTGSLGGTGFGPWVLEELNYNGRAGHQRIPGGTSNVPSSFGGALSLWALVDGVSIAERPFLQPLAQGDAFILQFDTNRVETGKTVGFTLADENGAPRFEFNYLGGASNYFVNDAIPFRETGIPYTQAGLEVRFEMISETAYRLSINGNQTLTGTLAAGGPIQRLAAKNIGAGSATTHGLYIGAMRIDTQILLREITTPAPVIVREVDPLNATDELPNEWWMQHFGTLSGVSATADEDGDGFSNAAEFRLGTSPLDSVSTFRLQPPVFDDGRFTIEWDAVAGKTYQLFGTPGLSPADWQPIGNRLTAPANGRQSMEHEPANPDRFFYRIQLVP